MGADHGEKSATPYVKHGALCLQTQYFPDSPHHANFPSTLVAAGETFESSTIYRFGVLSEEKESAR